MTTLLATVLPDDAPFDPIAWATGAEGYDRGVTFGQLAAMDRLPVGQGAPPEVMVAWRRSYIEGYLRAMCVRAAH